MDSLSDIVEGKIATYQLSHNGEKPTQVILGKGQAKYLKDVRAMIEMRGDVVTDPERYCRLEIVFSEEDSKVEVR